LMRQYFGLLFVCLAPPRLQGRARKFSHHGTPMRETKPIGKERSLCVFPLVSCLFTSRFWSVKMMLPVMIVCTLFISKWLS
jgi:hypothetical protein